ncbi:MAG: thermonuclease family protein [Planctomycetia bacterium]
MRPFRIPPPPPGMPRRLRGWYVLVATLLSAIVAAIPACPLTDQLGRPLWRVEVVHDGDTVTCIDEANRPQKIRLVGIDSPEFNQPFGREAAAALRQKLAGGRVRVEGDARDQHGRLLGTLWVDERNINRELVAEGWAWVFGGFRPDPGLLDAETAARTARRGLWADPRAQSPADWRRDHPPHR